MSERVRISPLGHRVVHVSSLASLVHLIVHSSSLARPTTTPEIPVFRLMQSPTSTRSGFPLFSSLMFGVLLSGLGVGGQRGRIRTCKLTGWPSRGASGNSAAPSQ